MKKRKFTKTEEPSTSAMGFRILYIIALEIVVVCFYSLRAHIAPK